MGNAACTVFPHLDWHSTDEAVQESCKAICRGCEIQARCLAGALKRDEPAGVWGGEVFGAVELADPVAWEPQVFAPEHGSRAAYLRCTDGEDGGKCAACRGANAAYQAGYRDHGPAVTRPAVMDVFEQLTIGAMA